MRKSLVAVAAALSLIGATSAAQAQALTPPSAAPLSVAAHFRANPPVDETSFYRGGIIIPTLIVLGIGALIYVLTKGDSPSSP